MMNHVIIWQGDQEQARQLAAGVEPNQYEHLLVICAPAYRECFDSLPCFDLPANPADSEAWQQTLLNVHVAVAMNTPAHGEPGPLILDVVISAAHSGDARPLLCALLSSAERVSGMNFAVHIILLLSTVSPYPTEQEALLRSLQEDVVSEGAKGTLRWNRLSVLSDWSTMGAASTDIARIRHDVLCGLIVEQDKDIQHMSYSCAAYGVQRTSFNRHDVRLLPRHMLYQAIASHKESIEDARKAFMPQLDELGRTFEKHLDNKDFPLTTALLADDDNYRERLGWTLIEHFLQKNGQILMEAMNISSEADQWLLNAKKRLASWIDADQTIRVYLQPGGWLESDLATLSEQLNENRPQYSTKMVFGSQASARNRRRNAQVAAKDLRRQLIWQGQLQFLKEIQARLPQLNAYLEEITNANKKYFKEYLPDLVDAFSGTPIANDVKKELHRFDMDHLPVTNLAVEDYSTWLENTLNECFFTPIEIAAHYHVLPDFKTLAEPYVEQDTHSFVMLNPSFNELEDSGCSIICLGASTTLYKLTIYHWQISKVSFTGVMTYATGMEHFNEAEIHHEYVEESKKHTYVDMKVSLEREEDHYVLHWFWPKESNILRLIISHKNGAICYSKKLEKPLLSGKGLVQIPINSLPQGETVLVRLEDLSGLFTEYKQAVPRIEQSLKMDEAFELLPIHLLPSSLHKNVVRIPKEISRGIPSNKCVLELEQGSHAFRYPIPENATKMIILCEPDKKWQRARLILEEN